MERGCGVLMTWSEMEDTNGVPRGIYAKQRQEAGTQQR